MLPDFPEHKAFMRKEITQLFRQAVRARLGPFQMARYSVPHEGDQWTLGGSEPTGYRRFETDMSLSHDEILHNGPKALKSGFEAMADEMASEQSSHFLDRLNEVVSKAGQSIDAGGKPFSAELYLEMLQKALIDFDQNGNPRIPHLIISPKHRKRVDEEIERLVDDPILRRQRAAILRDKKEEWRAREASRRLVD